MNANTRMSSWTGRQERGSAYLIRFIAWLALVSGRRVTRLLLYPITLYFILFAPFARRSSRCYLDRVLGRPAAGRNVFRHFHCFAGTILDRVFFLEDKFDLFDIEVEGLDQLHDAQKGGRGVILLGAHFGSFDAMRALARSAESRDLKVLMYDANASTVSAVLDAINPAFKEQIIPLGPPDSLIRVNDALNDGAMVGILGDRVTRGEKTFEVDFLGAPAKIATAPWVLAAVTGAPVVVFSAVFDGNRGYKVKLRRLPVETGARARDHEKGRLFAQSYIGIVEAWAREAPYNWFNFYDFWD